MTKEVIHTYRKFGTAIEFSIDEKGMLRVQVANESQKREISFIKGVPAELRSGLLDEAKKTHLKKILEDSYFVTIGPEIQVNARLRGGWGNEVHRGIWGTEGDDPEIPGTYTWATEIGFIDSEAMEIANVCAETDDVSSGIAPIPLFGDPSVHFNIHSPPVGRSVDGDEDDSRIQYAVPRLAVAIQMYREANPAWSTHLGHGLHALQDVFAHTDAFVTTYVSSEGHPIKVHVGKLGAIVGIFDTIARTSIHDIGFLPDSVRSNATIKGRNTDNPLYHSSEKGSPETSLEADHMRGTSSSDGREYHHVPSQRYSDTKTATYLYLAIFLCNTRYRDGTHAAEISSLCNRIRGVGANLRIQFDGPNRNAHRFHGLLARVAVTPGITVPPTIRALFLASLPSDIDAARSSMKTATFGVSRHAHPTVRGEREVEHNSDGTIKRIGRCLCSPTTHGLLSRGLRYDVFRHWGWGSAGYDGCDGYMVARANGTDANSPARPFPHDGIYTWDTPEARESKIRYTQGPGDQAWMEERDQRYLARLEREAATRISRGPTM